MLELMMCSMLTLLPDYLVRRYVQGKRIGHEITLFSVWYELRWGITLCLILTILLITLVLYNHPGSTNVNALFRTVSIFAETGGRVSDVYVGYNERVKKGQALFKIDSKRQEADIDTARAKIAEVDAQFVSGKAEIAKAQSQMLQATADLKQAQDELDVKSDLQRRNPGIVPQRDIEKLQVLVDGRQAALDAADATKQAAEANVSTLLPAQKASAQAKLAEAQVELERMTVRALVDGRLDQFVLRPGDVVQPAPVTRAAGILIPDSAGEDRLVAGFNQIEAQVIKVGMIAEATCITKPMTIIPLVVTNVQNVIAAGQILQTNQLTEMAKLGPPGTVLVFLQPLYDGVLDQVPPGSSCIANLYSNNHERLQAKDIGTGEYLYLHFIDAIALVHALVLRLHAVVLPLQALVFKGDGGGH
jgi:multidrug resistance efflux pump